MASVSELVPQKRASDPRRKGHHRIDFAVATFSVAVLPLLGIIKRNGQRWMLGQMERLPIGEGAIRQLIVSLIPSSFDQKLEKFLWRRYSARTFDEIGDIHETAPPSQRQARRKAPPGDVGPPLRYHIPPRVLHDN